MLSDLLGRQSGGWRGGPLRPALGAGFEEIVQLHFAIQYPHHGAVRSAIHRLLLRSRLDRELLFTARLGPSEVLTHGNPSK